MRTKLINPNDSDKSDFLNALINSNSQSELKKVLNTWYNKLNSISIVDDGHGMSLNDLKNVYLRIGTKSRRAQNEEGDSKYGDKGIGRLSAMCLGDTLSVTTKKIGENVWNKLKIDWTDFDCKGEKSVEEIPITPFKGDEKVDRKTHGTTLEIRGLSKDWDIHHLRQIVRERIARFVDPFIPGYGNEKLVFRFNGERVLVPSIPSKATSVFARILQNKF